MGQKEVYLRVAMWSTITQIDIVKMAKTCYVSAMLFNNVQLWPTNSVIRSTITSILKQTKSSAQTCSGFGKGVVNWVVPV